MPCNGTQIYDTDGYAIILKQIFNSFGGPCEIACIERKTEYYMVAQKYEIYFEC